jgi:hypothetical protein
MIIVTNNEAVFKTYKDSHPVDYKSDFTFLQVLEYCRDKIHKGAKLLTHPLTGSIKPNETPFKSIMIEEEGSNLDMESLMMIESAIETTKKFLSNHEVKEWPDRILDDFRLIDFRLITSAIESIG